MAVGDGMTVPDTTSKTERRGVLKGVGALALPLLTTKTATANTQCGQLEVTNIQPGWIQLDGSFESADGHVDADQSFDVRFEVNGTQEQSVIAYFVALAGQRGGEFVGVQGNHVTDTFQGTTVIHHGSAATDAFDPDPPLGDIPEGRYWLYVAVADRLKPPISAFGGGTSEAFEIS